MDDQTHEALRDIERENVQASIKSHEREDDEDYEVVGEPTAAQEAEVEAMKDARLGLFYALKDAEKYPSKFLASIIVTALDKDKVSEVIRELAKNLNS